MIVLTLILFRPLNKEQGLFLSRSVVVSWRDLVNRDLDSLFKTAVGSMIIILPADFSALSPDQRKVKFQFRSIQDCIIFILNKTCKVLTSSYSHG